MIKILIADDQELIRESLKIVLDMNADMKVVGLAEDGQKVLELLNKNRPDIILMDIRMPELDGVLCTKIVKEKFPNVKIVILTTFDDDEYVFYALKYGASGYLLKGCSVQELTAAIHTVRNVADLNRTERNIASLVGCGLSNKEIAEKLFLSEGTVRNALSSALSKLGLRDRTQLAIWAVQTGLPLMTD